MKINPSTATKQCEALDVDCAPPIRCELEAGHDGEHQWSGAVADYQLQEDGSTAVGERAVTKKFSTEAPPAAEPPGPPVKINVPKRARTSDVLGVAPGAAPEAQNPNT